MPNTYVEVLSKLAAMVSRDPTNRVYRNALRFVLNDEADADAYTKVPTVAVAAQVAA